MITVDQAIKTSCKAVGIPVEQFTDKRRIEENQDARGIAYKLIKDVNQWGPARIGRMTGKNHTSVMWAIKRVDESLETNGTLGKMYHECLRRTLA